jgi:outer membrane protein assembly factor BamB
MAVTRVLSRAMRRRIPLLVACLLAAACGGEAQPPLPSPPAASSSPTQRATSVAEPSASASPTPRVFDEWTTYMGDASRSGVGPATPAAGNAHRTWTAQIDGDMYAEPLVAGSSVIAATERNLVYAIDAATGAVRWRTQLGDPVPLAELQCGNIDPNGITSTPAVDTATGTIYIVAMLDSPMRHELFALRLNDGAIIWHRPVDPPGAGPRYIQQRGSLNIARGRVYFSYGGFNGDCGIYHGWVVSAVEDGSGALAAWQVPSNLRGAIWAPPGPVISATGDVWVSTGNTGSSTQGSYDGGNAVMRLDGALSKASDQWAPQNWRDLNVDDIDLGSLAPALLPGGLVFVAGKEGVGYLLRQQHLGGLGGEAFKATACPTGGPSGGAYGGAAVSGNTVFVPCKFDGLTALKVDASAPAFSVAWRAAVGANSPVLAYGLVWTVVAKPNGSHDTWMGTLVGVDPGTGMVRIEVGLGTVPHFPSPAAAHGSIYVAGLGSVYAVSVT